ncbi:hypothetical protein HDU93_001917 [Gonapodya sp. JEL0774]|nr:hypothetical protein HDU93_001917 [Gonapodya sp. JEL0774]
MSDTASVRGRRSKAASKPSDSDLDNDKMDGDDRASRLGTPEPSSRQLRARKDSVASSIIGAISSATAAATGSVRARRTRRDSMESVASDFSVASLASVATVSKRTMGPPPPVPPSRRRGSVASVANGSAPSAPQPTTSSSSHKRTSSTASVSVSAPTRTKSSTRDKDKDTSVAAFVIPASELKELGPMLDDDINQMTLRSRVVSRPWHEEGEVGRRLDQFFFYDDYGPDYDPNADDASSVASNAVDDPNDSDFSPESGGPRRIARGTTVAPPTPGTPAAAAVRVGGPATSGRTTRSRAAKSSAAGKKDKRAKRVPVRRIRWRSVAIAVVVLGLIGAGLVAVAGLGGWGPMAGIVKKLAEGAEEAAKNKAAAREAREAAERTPVPAGGFVGWFQRRVLAAQKAVGITESEEKTVKTARGAGPEVAVVMDENVKCWAMEGDRGHLTLTLPRRLSPTNLTYHHSPLQGSHPSTLSLYAVVPPLEAALALLRQPQLNLASAAAKGMFTKLATLRVGEQDDVVVDEDAMKGYEREAGGKGAEVVVVEVVRAKGLGSWEYTCVKGVGVWGRDGL